MIPSSSSSSVVIIIVDEIDSRLTLLGMVLKMRLALIEVLLSCIICACRAIHILAVLIAELI